MVIYRRLNVQRPHFVTVVLVSYARRTPKKPAGHRDGPERPRERQRTSLDVIVARTVP